MKFTSQNICQRNLSKTLCDIFRSYALKAEQLTMPNLFKGMKIVAYDTRAAVPAQSLIPIKLNTSDTNSRPDCLLEQSKWHNADWTLRNFT